MYEDKSPKPRPLDSKPPLSPLDAVEHCSTPLSQVETYSLKVEPMEPCGRLWNIMHNNYEILWSDQDIMESYGTSWNPMEPYRTP